MNVFFISVFGCQNITKEKDFCSDCKHTSYVPYVMSTCARETNISVYVNSENVKYGEQIREQPGLFTRQLKRKKQESMLNDYKMLKVPDDFNNCIQKGNISVCGELVLYLALEGAILGKNLNFVNIRIRIGPNHSIFDGFKNFVIKAGHQFKITDNPRKLKTKKTECLAEFNPPSESNIVDWVYRSSSQDGRKVYIGLREVKAHEQGKEIKSDLSRTHLNPTTDKTNYRKIVSNVFGEEISKDEKMAFRPGEGKGYITEMICILAEKFGAEILGRQFQVENFFLEATPPSEFNFLMN